MCNQMFPEESDRVEKYVGGLPDTIHDSVMATKPKTMQEAIEFATELMDKKIRNVVENKRKNQGHYRSDCPELKNQNHRNQTGGAEERGMMLALGGGETEA
ncbi:hypothetical protein Tco_0606458 [Tanacetum coccineum]